MLRSLKVGGDIDGAARCRKDIQGGGTASTEEQICTHFFSSFVRKQGQCEHPEPALHLILETVGIGELILALGEDTGVLYKAGILDLGRILERDVGIPVIDARQQKNRGEYNGSLFLKSSSDSFECPHPCLLKMKPWLFS